MAQPYVGEIRIFAGNYAPAGWMFCEGQVMPIEDNETLFQLIGTTYGGDGQDTFALPDLRGRIPVHHGGGFALAQAGGVEEVTLTVQHLPSHNHLLAATTTLGSADSPVGNLLASSAASNVYRPAPASNPMAAQSVALAGGSMPHSNMQPYLCVNHIISLYGVFPSPS